MTIRAPIIPLLLAALLSGIAAASTAQPAPKGARLLVPFDYNGVKLLPGPLKDQFDSTRAFYLNISNDDLLKGFRQRAGLPAPGKDLGGWYSADIFHIFGQIVSGLARMYAGTGDPICRNKVTALVHGFSQCIASDGYFYYSAHPNAPHYIFDKMVGGLVDAYHYCGSTEALPALHKITLWAEKNLDRTRHYGQDGNEWYTLTENLYRAYLVTGDPLYRDFGRVWEYTEYWNRYALHQDIFGPGSSGVKVDGYHAYSHVNTLGGNGAAYLVTGNTRYLDTLRNAYAYLQQNQCFATGGFGPDESLLPPGALLRHLADTHNSFETQCGSWAGFKMSKYLISFTGHAQYGDWVERLVLNGVGASIPETPDGRVFYYSDYNPAGATKVNTTTGWTCCAGTRPEAVADYVDLIYFRSGDGASIYTNLYTPSTVTWKVGSQTVSLQQSTRFPESDTSTFKFTVARPIMLTFNCRAPGWLAHPIKVLVNGTSAAYSVHSGWARVSRVWHSGDTVQVRLPFSLHAVPMSAHVAYPTAVMVGPVALSFNGTAAQVVGNVNPAHLAASLIPDARKPLRWRVKGATNVTASPFYAVPAAQPYLLYLDPAALNHVNYRDVTYTGPWNDAGVFRFCNIVGSSARYTFTGTGIQWLGYRFDDGGAAEVRIDGGAPIRVDQYGPGRSLPFDWHVEGLSPAKHTITITLIAEKPPQSRDRFLNVAGFKILGGS